MEVYIYWEFIASKYIELEPEVNSKELELKVKALNSYINHENV